MSVSSCTARDEWYHHPLWWMTDVIMQWMWSRLRVMIMYHYGMFARLVMSGIVMHCTWWLVSSFTERDDRCHYAIMTGVIMQWMWSRARVLLCTASDEMVSPYNTFDEWYHHAINGMIRYHYVLKSSCKARTLLVLVGIVMQRMWWSGIIKQCMSW